MCFCICKCLDACGPQFGEIFWDCLLGKESMGKEGSTLGCFLCLGGVHDCEYPGRCGGGCNWR